MAMYLTKGLNPSKHLQNNITNEDLHFKKTSRMNLLGKLCNVEGLCKIMINFFGPRRSLVDRFWRQAYFGFFLAPFFGNPYYTPLYSDQPG